MKVAIIGTVGIPANYGGFETLVEQLVRHNKNSELEYEVYCSKKAYSEHPDTWLGARLRYVNLKANGMQSIPYDIISLIKATRHNDVVLVLGVSGCAFLPIYRWFSKKKLIINIDGLEHRRAKWSKFVRKFLKYSEAKAVKHGDVIITDNKGITDYVTQEYGKTSRLIAYGGNHALCQISDAEAQAVLDEYGLEKDGYGLALCRIEPENNVHTILAAYKDTGRKLVFIGNWDNSPYGIELKEKYKDSKNIRLLSAIYDIKKLNAIRSHCAYYLHGHSAGGTNPSLVEAMFFGKPILAFDVIYNRATTEGRAHYFKDETELLGLLERDAEYFAENAAAMKEVAERNYRWETIATEYEALY